MPDDTDYYAGEDQAAPATTTDTTPDDADKSDDQATGGNSALVAKSLFGGSAPEVGSTVSFKVVHIYDDEVEVEPVSDDNEKKSSSPEMDEAEDRLGSMATMNGAAEA